MILDKHSMFSDRQAITSNAASSQIIDLGVSGQNLGFGTKVPLIIQVNEGFSGIQAIKIILQTSDSSEFSDSVDLVEVKLTGSGLMAGGRPTALDALPSGPYKRYLRLYYELDGGAPSSGKITAGVSMGADETYPYR
jgi:hypothetical protein